MEFCLKIIRFTEGYLEKNEFAKKPTDKSFINHENLVSNKLIRTKADVSSILRLPSLQSSDVFLQWKFSPVINLFEKRPKIFKSFGIVYYLPKDTFL